MSVSCSHRIFFRFISVILIFFLVTIIYIIISSDKNRNKSQPDVKCINIKCHAVIPSQPVVKIHGIQVCYFYILLRV